MAILFDLYRRIELAEERARAGTTQEERLYFQDAADILRNRLREESALERLYRLEHPA